MGSLAKTRALVVEDESFVLMLIEDMLRELGVEGVETATTLAEAVEHAQSAQVDFAVLDVNLLGLKSYPAAQVLRDRGVPVLFLTGYGAAGHEVGWKDAPTLSKPFQISSLESAIDQVLAGASA